MPSSLGTCTLAGSLWQLPVCLFATGVSDQEQHHCTSTAFLLSICRILLTPENENPLEGKQFQISRSGERGHLQRLQKKANRVTSSSGTTTGRNVWQQKTTTLNIRCSKTPWWQISSHHTNCNTIIYISK